MLWQHPQNFPFKVNNLWKLTFCNRKHLKVRYMLTLYKCPTCLHGRIYCCIKETRKLINLGWLECSLEGWLPRDFKSLLLPWEGLRQRQSRPQMGTFRIEGVGSLEIRLGGLHRAEDDRYFLMGDVSDASSCAKVGRVPLPACLVQSAR